MGKAFRNLMVGTLTVAVAVMLAALGQVGFEHSLPTLSHRLVGATDLSTYALLLFVAVLFLAMGVIAPRWLRTPIPFAWLVMPLVALYLVVFLAFPYGYRCVPGLTPGCWIVHSPFVVATAGLSVGCYLRRSSGPS